MNGKNSILYLFLLKKMKFLILVKVKDEVFEVKEVFIVEVDICKVRGQFFKGKDEVEIDDDDDDDVLLLQCMSVKKIVLVKKMIMGFGMKFVSKKVLEVRKIKMR